MKNSPNDNAVIDLYLDALFMEKGLSQNTLASYQRDLIHFDRWLATQSANLLGVNKTDIESYLSFRLQNKQSARSTARLLSCLRVLPISAT